MKPLSRFFKLKNVLTFGLLWSISSTSFATNLPARTYSTPALWGQLFSGTIQSNQFLKKMGHAGRASVMVWDSGFFPDHLQLGDHDLFKTSTRIAFKGGSHGNQVVANLLGDKDYASSHFANLIYFSDSKNSRDLIQTIQQKKPDVVSSSVAEVLRQIAPSVEATTGIDISGIVTNEMTKKIADAFGDATFVVAAGNDYPTPFSETAGLLPSIDVGSIAELGIPAGYSNQAIHVDIYAPSGIELLSFDEGALKLFAGTSGAQPLVAGAVATLKSILPGLNLKNVRYLLKKTAVPYVLTGLSVPVLNSYRLTRLAWNLKLQGWNNWSAPKRQKMLLKADVSQFKSEAALLALSTEEADLLESFLLDPNANVAKKLSDHFQSIGFSDASIWFRNMGPNALQTAITLEETITLSATHPSKFTKQDLTKYLIQSLIPHNKIPEAQLIPKIDELLKSDAETLLFELWLYPKALKNKLLDYLLSKDEFLKFIFSDDKLSIVSTDDYQSVLDRAKKLPVTDDTFLHYVKEQQFSAEGETAANTLFLTQGEIDQIIFIATHPERANAASAKQIIDQYHLKLLEVDIDCERLLNGNPR